MNDTESENKAGIYLCININRNFGYLIIWPGKNLVVNIIELMNLVIICY